MATTSEESHYESQRTHSLTTSSLRVDPQEARATVSAVRTAYDPRPQSYPLPPGQGMQSDIPGHHRHVQIVSSLCLDVHIAAKYLKIQLETSTNKINMLN